MIQFLKRKFNKLFRRRFKSYLLNDNYRVVEAFSFHGTKYYCFDDAFRQPRGRAITALTIYEELKMNCDKEYLEKHLKAVDIILSDPKKINIAALVLIHNNLKERLQMVAMPDYIFKLASVMYFDDTESPYSYDGKYNQKKIAEWKKDPDALIFFLKGPLKDSMPLPDLSSDNAQIYFSVAEEVNSLHHANLSQVLSKSI